MSVFKSKKSAPYFWFDFQTSGRRFYGSTGCTSRREAEKYEAIERERAKAVIKAQATSRTSLAIDDVAHRLWSAKAQHDSDADATSTNLARLVDYFGKATPLTDIDHAKATKLV